MKKYIITLATCIGLSLAFAGCQNKEEKNTDETTKQVVDINNKEESTKEAKIGEKDPKIPVGLYNAETGTRVLEPENVSLLMTSGEDIISLEIYASKDASLSGNQKALWNEKWNTVENNTSYKTGLFVTVSLEDGTSLKGMILGPNDDNNYANKNEKAATFKNYVELWLYDDVNQPDGIGWYSHILESEVSEKTLISSVKFTAGADISKVKSITVSAFVYNVNDKSKLENGEEIPANSYTVTMVKK